MQQQNKTRSNLTSLIGGGRRRLCVLGGGESGVGAALLGRQQGYDVFLSDAGYLNEKYKTELSENNIAYEEGGHTAERILSCE